MERIWLVRGGTQTREEFNYAIMGRTFNNEQKAIVYADVDLIKELAKLQTYLYSIEDKAVQLSVYCHIQNFYKNNENGDPESLKINRNTFIKGTLVQALREYGKEHIKGFWCHDICDTGYFHYLDCGSYRKFTCLKEHVRDLRKHLTDQEITNTVQVMCKKGECEAPNPEEDKYYLEAMKNVKEPLSSDAVMKLSDEEKGIYQLELKAKGWAELQKKEEIEVKRFPVADYGCCIRDTGGDRILANIQYREDLGKQRFYGNLLKKERFTIHTYTKGNRLINEFNNVIDIHDRRPWSKFFIQYVEDNKIKEVSINLTGVHKMLNLINPFKGILIDLTIKEEDDLPF